MNPKETTADTIAGPSVGPLAVIIRRLYEEGLSEGKFALEPCRQDDEDDAAYQLTFRTEFSAPESSSSLALAARAASDRSDQREGTHHA